ncbi:50S ribosomal protein L3 [bacterium endosymbiont of Pedicinus badii]|uniref:50S ribosomal protein L3 n=1 Tax=bacterium endosymbiont of Pedicinus badii TaxID=1719126 RepID=UPI0009BB6996|nr:50S ribosomal protein L3 [bacterium endosymbiont of Pedicinus badii]OQM34100.1 50S ribosomal protein L3 [bacterium endosymbiont of Pedicinus badii]
MIGLVGKKIGITRIFDQKGNSIPVTIVKFEDNFIVSIKTKKKHGYSAIQVTTGEKKNKKVKKPYLGIFLKSSLTPGIGLWEFRTNKENYKIGQKINLKIFSKVKKVDILGYSKGKGFSGTIKRWHFRSQDATHGNSLSHRAPGSIGQNQTPGRTFKGKKMSGRLGNKKVTIQNLKIIRIDEEKNILLVKGCVPGSVGGNIIVKPAIKIYFK